MDHVDWIVLVGLMIATVLVVGDFLAASIVVGLVTALVTGVGYIRYSQGRRAEGVAWFTYLFPILLFPLTYTDVDGAEAAVVATAAVATLGLGAAKFGLVADERGGADDEAENSSPR